MTQAEWHWRTCHKTSPQKLAADRQKTPVERAENHQKPFSSEREMKAEVTRWKPMQASWDLEATLQLTMFRKALVTLPQLLAMLWEVRTVQRELQEVCKHWLDCQRVKVLLKPLVTAKVSPAMLVERCSALQCLAKTSVALVWIRNPVTAKVSPRMLVERCSVLESLVKPSVALVWI